MSIWVTDEDGQNEYPDMGSVSDGYHTFDELYYHRIALSIALMKSWPALSWRSLLHDDATHIKGWFIAGMHLPTGDISYHLPITDWVKLDNTGIKTTGIAPHWDGHTPDDVVDRLDSWMKHDRLTHLKEQSDMWPERTKS